MRALPGSAAAAAASGGESANSDGGGRSVSVARALRIGGAVPRSSPISERVNTDLTFVQGRSQLRRNVQEVCDFVMMA